MSELPDGVGGRTNANFFSPSSLDPLDKFRKGSKIYRIAEFFLTQGGSYNPTGLTEKLIEAFPDLFNGDFKTERDTVRKTCQRLAHEHDPPILVQNPHTRFYSCIDALYDREVQFIAQFFDPLRPLEVHDVAATGHIENLFQLLECSAALPGFAWTKGTFNVKGCWVRVYTKPPDEVFPAGYRVTVRVFSNDSVKNHL